MQIPLLWIALALEIQTVRSVDTQLMASWLFSFTLPESITHTTSSIVIPVSAMFVDKMIFCTPKESHDISIFILYLFLFIYVLWCLCFK